MSYPWDAAWEEARPGESERERAFRVGAAKFDYDYEGISPVGTDPRRQAILNLVERGATEGERAAARAALERIDQDAQDEADFEDALVHGEA